MISFSTSVYVEQKLGQVQPQLRLFILARLVCVGQGTCVADANQTCV